MIKKTIYQNIFDLAVDLLTLLIVGISVGVALGIVSNLFVKGVNYLSNISLENILPNFLSIYTPIFSLLLAAITIIIIRKLFDISRWHGPPDSILAAHQYKNSIDIKRGLGSTLTAFISASGGASVGQYGPLVHFGATIASVLENFTSKRLPPGIFIGCGVAAAISAGFNAPIAGLVFAHEAILRHFSLRAGGAIAISSITASTIGTGIFSGAGGLKVIENAPKLLEITPVILVISPLFGLVAILFIFGIRTGAKIAKLTKLSFTSQIFLAALICGTVGIFIPEILGLGNLEMNSIYSNAYDIQFLFILLIGKIIMTSICIGFGFFGGVFAPALFVGAAAGGFLAKFIMMIGFSISLPAVALAGTAAVGAVVIGAPIATTLIILEFTGRYEYAVAAMIAVQVSSFITHRLYGDSLFDMALLDRKIKIGLGRQHIQMNDILLSKIITNEALVFDISTSVKKIRESMKINKVTEAVIIDSVGNFIGKINVYDILETKEKLIKEISFDKNILVLNGNISLIDSIKEASNFVGEFIPVKDENNKFIGSVTEADIFKAYLDLQNQVLKVEKDTES